MEPFIISVALVALAEIGDKTQLLAIVLMTRFQRPTPVILGILFATIANHVLAATAGYFLSGMLLGKWFQYLLAALFIAMAIWSLFPDRLEEQNKTYSRANAFTTTLIAFFLVEIGDKTQIATAALAARFHDILLVAAGTTTGMMLADIPAVLLAEAALKIVPLRYVRIGAALLFLALGLLGLAEAAGLTR